MKNSLLLFFAFLLALAPRAMAQELTVTGTVTDESDIPLPGVSVFVKSSFLMMSRASMRW